MKSISIIWFRQDLRLSDNPAVEAASHSNSVLPIYILDDCAPKQFTIGAATKIALWQSLIKLNNTLDKKLNFYIGRSIDIIESLSKQYHIKNIFWNACYEPWHLKQSYTIETFCKKKLIPYKIFNSNYLWDPNTVLKDDGSYYKVFSAYKKKSYFFTPRRVLRNRKKMNLIKDSKNKTTHSNLNLIPQNEKWHQKILSQCEMGEVAAQKKLNYFIENKLLGYKDGRDYPAADHTSLLSVHLHFGEISPAQIWEAINAFDLKKINDSDRMHFCSEIIWREFSCYLLYHTQRIHIDNFNKKFDCFPWKNNRRFLTAWQKGQTGFPIVDAGMRQLWQTGYMHNRVRMIVASFLVKNLNTHWYKGRDWFWDCLLDADLANNSASWQWVAGSGVDAAPYFRIFNPITQGEKFDKQGDYTRKFVPELKNIPDKYLFKPWTAPQEILDSADIVLGKTYPNPVVDLSVSRNDALSFYKKL